MVGSPFLQNYINDKTIVSINDALAIWKNKIYTFAYYYINSDRKEIEFFNDIITISKSLSVLPKKCLGLLEIGEATTLFHNRLIAQIIESYYEDDMAINLPSSKSKQKIHDFEIKELKCEVKTIQSLGDIERDVGKGFRLKDKTYKSLSLAIRDDLDNADKVRNIGMVFLAPYSYNINSILCSYFESNKKRYTTS